MLGSVMRLNLPCTQLANPKTLFAYVSSLYSSNAGDWRLAYIKGGDVC